MFVYTCVCSFVGMYVCGGVLYGAVCACIYICILFKKKKKVERRECVDVYMCMYIFRYTLIEGEAKSLLPYLFFLFSVFLWLSVSQLVVPFLHGSSISHHPYKRPSTLRVGTTVSVSFQEKSALSCGLL